MRVTWIKCAVFLAGFLFLGCSDASNSIDVQRQLQTDSMTEEEVYSSDSPSAESLQLDQKTILEAIPAHISEKICVGEITQSLDADIDICKDNVVMKGTLELREFTEDEVKSLLKNSKFIDNPDELDIEIDGSYLCIRKNGYKKYQEIIDTETCDINELSKCADDFLQEFDDHWIQKEGNAFSAEEGNIYNFQAVAMLHDTILEMKSKPVSFRSDGSLLNGKLGDFEIQADYKVQEETEASLMEFSEIIENLKKLLQDGTIVPVPSGEAIKKVRLCYMVEQHAKTYDFYPVWNFEVSYTAEWLKGSDGPHATRYVVLDACTGELVEYHIGGPE